MEESGGLQSMGSLWVRHDWATSLSLFTFMHWRRKCNPLQCSCLENPMDGGTGGLPSMGSHRVGHDWSDLAAATRLFTQFFFHYCLPVSSGTFPITPVPTILASLKIRGTLYLRALTLKNFLMAGIVFHFISTNLACRTMLEKHYLLCNLFWIME